MVTLFFLMFGGIALYGQQNQAEVPGDNFSLEGALELFKKSTSPEEFERLLNSSDARVNNLDLNGDGDIDYIKVIDRNEGNVHAFILQAVISERESQDVAVIELEKLANGKAVLQITGDADIYGIETIIEPTQEVRINAGASTSRTVVNVWAWPSVQYVYSPYYSSLWVSPWGWNMRPVWWHSWSPVAYQVYNPWWTPYRPYYAPCYNHRIAYASNIYRPYRTTSVVVYNRHNTQISHYRSTHNDYNRNGGRDRYDGHTNGRQNGAAYRNSSDGRQRSSSTQNNVSRSNNDVSRNYNDNTGRQRSSSSQNNGTLSDHNLNRSQNNLNRRTPSTTHDSNSRSRSTSDFRSSPDATQRGSSNLQRQESSRTRSTVPDQNVRTQQPSTRPSQVTRPNTELRNNQRSNTVQPSRTRSSVGGGNVQRSGNNASGNKPNVTRRGRD